VTTAVRVDHVEAAVSDDGFEGAAAEPRQSSRPPVAHLSPPGRGSRSFDACRLGRPGGLPPPAGAGAHAGGAEELGEAVRR
jgi:hypothetical protein